MSSDAYRLEVARRLHEGAQRRGRSWSPLARLGADARFRWRRGLDAVRRVVDRAATPRPQRATGAARDFLVVGHRGSPVREVENTIPAMRRAVEVEGANAVEIDLSFTKDGHVVLWHDWLPNDAVALARQLGLEPNVKFYPDAPDLWDDFRRPVPELTLAELRRHYGYKRKRFFLFFRKVEAHIPTFEEFLQWAGPRPELQAVFLDLKVPEDDVDLVQPFVDSICAQLDAHRAGFEAVFMTPHQAVLERLKQVAPGRPVSYDIEVPPGVVLTPTEHSGARAAIEHGNSYASVGRPALTLGAWRIYQEIIEHDVALCAEHNANEPSTPVRRLIGWTINDKAENRRLLELGVQAILTDKPGALRRQALRCGRQLA